jgi:hypothetical protein
MLSEVKRAWSALWKSRIARSSALEDLIRGVEESSGCARTDARAKAKAWLISHVASMNPRDIEVARSHFGYLLPAEWGIAS